MKMQRQQFRIGEVAKRLNVERFVIRFWEKEFNLQPTRSHGGQRFYEEKDFQKLKQIKELLYKKGFTINGARQQIQEKKTTQEIIGSHRTTLDEQHQDQALNKNLIVQIKTLRRKLIKLQKQF